MGDLSSRMQVDYGLSVGIAAPYDALSAADEDVQIVDAFGRWALPTGLGVTSIGAGVQRVPFSREAMISSADLVFQERAVATNWLTPGREAGAIVAQSVTFGDSDLAPQVLARIGVFNGNGDVFGDTDPGVLGSARLEFLLGDAYRTFSSDLDPALGVGLSGLKNDEIATSTTSLGADLLARFSVVTLMGEVLSSGIELAETDVVDPDILGPVDRFGWLGQLSVFVPIDGPHGVEIAGRYATFDDDTDRDNAGDVGILHAGATWRSPVPRVDVGLGFIHRTETEEVTNDTFRIWTQVRPEAHLRSR
jgi:hypothetical protein